MKNERGSGWRDSHSTLYLLFPFPSTCPYSLPSCLARCTQGYAMLLMYAMERPELSPHVRQSAAIAFKNLIKKKWDSDTGISQISDADRKHIKEHGAGGERGRGRMGEQKEEGVGLER